MSLRNYLIIATLLVTITTSAQYGDAYHAPNTYLIEKQQREYGEKQRDMARAGTNSKSMWGGSSSGPNKEAEELAAKWKANFEAASRYNTYKPTPEEAKKNAEAARLKEQRIAAYKIEQKASRDKSMADMYAKHAIAAPYVQRFLDAGFTEEEAKDLGRYRVMDGEANLRPNHQQVLDLIPLFKSVNDNLYLMSFDDFKTNFDLLYFYAPLTTIGLVEDVMQRFPDKALELDDMQLNCILTYYNAHITSFDTANANKMADYFFALLKRHPDLDMYVLEHTKKWNNPYEAKIDYLKYYGKSTKKESKQYYALMGRILKKREAAAKSTAAIETLLAENNTLRLYEIVSQPYIDGLSSVTDSYCMIDKKFPNPLPYNGYMEKPLRIRCTPETLKELSENGNVEAQEMYNLYLFANPNEAARKQLRETILKGAVAGDYRALLLYAYTPIWDFSFTDATLRRRYNAMTPQEYNAGMAKNMKERDAMLAELKATIEKSIIPAAHLVKLGVVLYTNSPQYGYLEGYQAYGQQLTEKYKAK